MKIITMYLPQFHRVKENDEWWGEGFTEWTAVKGAEMLYTGHDQPRVPLHKNYYDLMEKNVMQWQSELMREYGIDAQCFYHYWFKDGRQILEKPAENLLKWKDIDMCFCFCWANQTWARSWSKIINKNTWADAFEGKDCLTGNGILLEQKYGDEKQWRQHFEYLLSFFKDERYIKIGNKPLFLISIPSQIPCLAEMTAKWNVWIQESGFDGIYIIGGNGDRESANIVDAVLYHEPAHTFNCSKQYMPKEQRPKKFDYDKLWEELLKTHVIDNKVFYGGFVGYDDTPRRGRDGLVVDNFSPEKFQLYLSRLIAKNVANHQNMIFINAWNEWGEGMYLEPDEKYGFQYLEAVRNAKIDYKRYLDDYSHKSQLSNQQLSEKVEFWSSRSEKYERYWKLLDAWLSLKEEHIFLEDYFLEKKIGTIAIYGMGFLGRHLLKELEGGKVQISYGIDRRSEAIHGNIKVMSPDGPFPRVDCIVVTVTYDFANIQKLLYKRGCSNIVSLETIITELL